MKEMVKSFHTAVAERIKNPLIGTFILSWIFYNRSGVTNFVLGDTEVKKAIVAGYSIDGLEILIPLAITCGYVLLSQLVLPFIQYQLDQIKLQYIDKKRFKHRADLSKENSKQEASANKEKYKAQMDYMQRLADKELLDCEDEKIEFKAEMQTLNKECDELYAKVKSLTDERTKLNDLLETADKKHKELTSKVKALTIELHESQKSASTMRELSDGLINYRDEQKNKINELLASNQELSSELNEAKLKLAKFNKKGSLRDFTDIPRALSSTSLSRTEELQEKAKALSHIQAGAPLKAEQELLTRTGLPINNDKIQSLNKALDVNK